MKRNVGGRVLLLLMIAAVLLSAGLDVFASPEPAGENSSPEPSGEPLMPGTYEGSDGSILTIGADGACAFETLVTGTINGIPVSGRLTFCGTGADGAFDFTRVSYYGVDLTEIARTLGYEDASPWEQAAAVLYADALGLKRPAAPED